MYAPIVDRESTDTIMPWSNLNARVVVPLANFTVWFESAAPHADAKLLRQKCAGSATLGISKAAGSPRNLEGHMPPEPDAITCLLLSSALRVPMSRISVVTADGPNMFVLVALLI